MDETVLTLHPQNKQGVQISKRKYDFMRKVIVETLQSRDKLTHMALTQAIEQRLDGRFDGSVPWYVTTIKLDLEARGLIQRVPGTAPTQLRLTVN
jgi:hypothetical protein